MVKGIAFTIVKGVIWFLFFAKGYSVIGEWKKMCLNEINIHNTDTDS